MSDHAESDVHPMEVDSVHEVSIGTTEERETPPSQRSPKNSKVASVEDDLIVSLAPRFMAGVIEMLDSATFDIECSIQRYRTMKRKTRRTINESRVVNAEAHELVRSVLLATTLCAHIIELMNCLQGGRIARKRAKPVITLLVRLECMGMEGSKPNKELGCFLAKADVAVANLGEALDRLHIIEADLEELTCDMISFTNYSEAMMGVDAPEPGDDDL